MKRITTYARSALALLLGERCVVCGCVSTGADVCPKCLLKLPYINIRGVADDMIERLFWGALPIVRASSMLEYAPNNSAQLLLESIKYKGRSDIAVKMGCMMGEALIRRGFFEGIDCIQPVPLHPNRRMQRGYNQSEELARGIAEVARLPIVDLVRRTTDNVSQTKLSHTERIGNVKDIFAPNTAEIQRLRPHHILFVDDVITTGSTLISCVQAIVGKPEERSKIIEAIRNQADKHGLSHDNHGVESMSGHTATTPPLTPKISVLSLAYAGKLCPGFRTPEELHHPLQLESNKHFRNLQQRPFLR